MAPLHSGAQGLRVADINSLSALPLAIQSARHQHVPAGQGVPGDVGPQGPQGVPGDVGPQNLAIGAIQPAPPAGVQISATYV